MQSDACSPWLNLRRAPGQAKIRSTDPSPSDGKTAMSDRYLSHVRSSLATIRADGFYKTSGSSRARSRRPSAWPTAPRCSISSPTNYLGLADDDARLIAAAKEALDRHGYGMASVRFSAARRTGTRSWKPPCRVPEGRRLHPLLELLRRQRRPLRDAARGGGRCAERRAEPREHRRRHPPVQGEALPVPQQRHGGPRGEAARSRRGRRALQAHRDRRRLLDGRHRGQPAGVCDLARRFDAHTRWTIRTRWIRRRCGPRHARALRVEGESTSHGPLDKARGGASEATRREGISRNSCASARGP